MRGVPLAAVGALLGVIALSMTTQLGLLLGAASFGLRVRHVVIGALRTVRVWRHTRCTVTLRALPVTVESEIGPRRSPAIARSWLAGLMSALAGAAVVGTSWWWTGEPLGRGFALAATALMLVKLWPKRAPLVTSTGWLLFGLPRMPEQRRCEFRASALAAGVYDSLHIGDFDGAQTRADELTAAYPDSEAALACQVSLAEAAGQHARATLLLLGRVSEGDAAPREMSYLLAGLAGAAFVAVEAGELDADDVLPTAEKALRDAIRFGYPELHLSGTKAVQALLDGDADKSARLATLGAEYTTSPLSRADDLATLARAHMARRDNAAARRALTLAEQHAAWWPRVRRTRQRLDVR